MSQFKLDPEYKEVSERIRDFRERYPDGCLQSEILASPVAGFVVVAARAYRTPDDPRPGVGLAWEPVPGKTPYTKDSELMNAETSAWGRAIIAVGASDAKHVASADEVRARAAEREPEAEPPKAARQPARPQVTPEQRATLEDIRERHAKLLDAEQRKYLDAALASCKPDVADKLIARLVEVLGGKGVEYMLGDALPGEKAPALDYDAESIPF